MAMNKIEIQIVSKLITEKAYIAKNGFKLDRIGDIEIANPGYDRYIGAYVYISDGLDVLAEIMGCEILTAVSKAWIGDGYFTYYFFEHDGVKFVSREAWAEGDVPDDGSMVWRCGRLAFYEI